MSLKLNQALLTNEFRSYAISTKPPFIPEEEMLPIPFIYQIF